jgi:hypothetical protein
MSIKENEDKEKRQDTGESEEASERNTRILEIAGTAATVIMNAVSGGPPIINFNLGEVFSTKKQTERIKEMQRDKIELFSKLRTEGIDQAAFEQHLNNEINRTLKKQYGSRFFFITFFFTVLSFSIVILNSILHWNIPDGAIIGLIIEIPIQFVGIMYIVAKHLFPNVEKSEKTKNLPNE